MALPCIQNIFPPLCGSEDHQLKLNFLTIFLNKDNADNNMLRAVLLNQYQYIVTQHSLGAALACLLQITRESVEMNACNSQRVTNVCQSTFLLEILHGRQHDKQWPNYPIRLNYLRYKPTWDLTTEINSESEILELQTTGVKSQTRSTWQRKSMSITMCARSSMDKLLFHRLTFGVISLLALKPTFLI